MHDHSHRHSAHLDSIGPLKKAILLTLSFAVIEALGGWFSGSLALLSDAGHMASDSFALGLALLAAWLIQRPSSARHSYGLGRTEVIAALINGFFMLAIVAAIVIAAIDRLYHPRPVSSVTVMIIATIGLVINVFVLRLLKSGAATLNTRGAILHVIGDLLGSVAALIAGIIIYFTHWYPIDPILSLLICAILLFSSVRLLREALNIIMEAVPDHIDIAEVKQAMTAPHHVLAVHDLHIWTLSSGITALSAHITLDHMKNWQYTLNEQELILSQRFTINHITLQPEINPTDDNSA